MRERFDTIIVGAGPAGSIAAYQLAKAGLKVLVIERGEYPGSKNVFGGVLHSAILNELFPNFWNEAPVERYMTKRVIVIMAEASSISIEFQCQDHGEPPYNGFTVLRAKFDQWLANKAEEAGALIVTDSKVDDLLWKDKKVIGVKVGKEKGEVLADVVIAADGANSLIARKANLRKSFFPDQMALGVKEIWEMPKGFIERRFNVAENEGAAYLFVGRATGGLEGGGFVYTNKKSLSIGITTHLGGLAREKKEPSKVLEEFKLHPIVEDLINQGTMREYSAHLVPEGGINMIPQLYSDGILVIGDAAGLTANNGFNVRGVDFAIGSGIFAAQTILRAKERSDFSKKSLSIYRDFLEGSFVLKDLKVYRGFPALLRNRALYDAYPQMICNIVKDMYDVDNNPKKRLAKLLLDEVRKNRSIKLVSKDILKGIKAI